MEHETGNIYHWGCLLTKLARYSIVGWADAMAKVLRTQKDVEDAGKLLLSKAKKDYERKSKTIDGENAETTEEGKTVDKARMSAKVILTNSSN